MTDVSQCPFCELRFQGRWELKLHLDAEHPGRIRERDDPTVVIEDNDPLDPESL